MSKKLLKIFSYFLLLMSFEHSLMAADEKGNPEIELSSAIMEKFVVGKGFDMINPDLISLAILSVPGQTQRWSCGKHAGGHCSVINKGANLVLNYEKPENFPLSVDVRLTPELKQTLAGFKVNLPTDEEGYFRVGPVPCQMENYLRDCLGGETPVYAVSHAQREDGFQAFSDAVQQSIAKDLPVLAYYVVNAEAKMMHFYTIVGHRAGAHGIEKIAVLDSTGDGLKRIRTFNAHEFFEHMNAQSIVGLVNMLNNPFLRPIIESMVGDNGTLASPNKISSWKPFSYLTFVKPPEELLCKPKQDKQGCAQQ